MYVCTYTLKTFHIIKVYKWLITSNKYPINIVTGILKNMLILLIHDSYKDYYASGIE